jgi:hypothetical protein
MFKSKKLNKAKIYKWGISAGIGQLIYIVLVVLIIMALDQIMKETAAYGGPLAMLLVLILLVFSAAISGLIVFGYPAYLFLQKNYKQAVCTVLTSLATILIGFLFVLLVVFTI